MKKKTVGTAGRKAKRAQARERIVDRTNKLIARSNPAWFAQERGLKITQGDISSVLRELGEVFETADQVRWARRTVTSILNYGARKLDWSVEAIPAPIIRIPRPMSPFAPTAFMGVHALSPIQTKHQRALDRPEPQFRLDPAYRAGQLLFSAIVSGALFNRSLVEKFAKNIDQQLNIHSNYLWFDFLLNEDTPTDRPAYRRWFPDPVTTCLILRWRLDGLIWPREPPDELSPDEPSTGELSADKLLTLYLARIGVKLERAIAPLGTAEGSTLSTTRRYGLWCTVADPTDILTPSQILLQEPSALAFILTAAETRAREWVPGTLVDFAVSVRAGISLPPDAWWRTVLDRQLVKEVTKAPEPDEVNGTALDRVTAIPEKASDRQWTKATADEDQWILFRMLRDRLRATHFRLEPGKAVQKLKDFKEIFGDKLSHIVQALLAWAIWCIEAREFGTGRIKVSSTRRYLDAVARGLIAIGAELDFGTLDADGYSLLYEAALKLTNSLKARSYMRDRLVEFHEFLRLYFNAPAIIWQGGLKRPISFPDANILTEAEFQRVLLQLGTGDTERDRDRNRLVGIFGYRLGMRRDEIAGLTLDSLQGVLDPRHGLLAQRPQLWVHVTELSGVKRTSSARRLPLALLLTQDDLKLLGVWIARRFNENGNRWDASRPLFTETAGGTQKLGDEPFRAVTVAMHLVTGDIRLHFHHCRHSFITLLNARMLAIDDPAERSPLPPSWESEHKRLGRSALLHAFFHQDVPARGTIYQTAALAGQLDPQETLQSYNHCFDWLIERHMAFEGTQVTLGLLATCRGETYGNFGAKRSRDQVSKEQPSAKELKAVMDRLIAEVGSRGWIAPAPASAEFKAVTAVSAEKPRSLLDLTIDDIYALALSAKKAASNAERGTAFGVPSSEIRAFLAAAYSRSRSLTTPRSSKNRSPRHLAHAKTNRRAPDARKFPEIQGLGPALPTAQKELKDARRVFSKLKTAFQEHPTAVIAALETFAICDNRNNPGLTSNKAEVVEALAQLVQLSGIERHRIRLSVLSIPKNSDFGNVAKELGQLFKVPLKAIQLTSDEAQARGRSRFGRVNLRVIQPFVKSRVHLESAAARSAFGWKVACFYMLCVAQAATK